MVAIGGHLPRVLKGPCPFPNEYRGETGLSLFGGELWAFSKTMVLIPNINDEQWIKPLPCESR